MHPPQNGSRKTQKRKGIGLIKTAGREQMKGKKLEDEGSKWLTEERIRGEAAKEIGKKREGL